MLTSRLHSAAGRAVTIAAMVVTSATAATAQTATLSGEVGSMIVASDPSVGGQNNPIYAADRSAGSDYNGIVNLWFRNSGGAVIHACTGSNLGSGKILTAAHCVSNGSSLIASSFTARFFQAGTGWFDVHGSGFAVKSGYSGAVIEENDVAVLTLASDAPVWARSYSLATGSVLGATQTFAGYGRTGTGVTGASMSSNQFNDAALLRRGLQTFESTCKTGGSCATQFHPTPGQHGGILLSDFDESGVSSPGFMCGSLGFCGSGHGGFEEVGIGPGDSGGASFLNDWSITGVASFGQTSGGIGSFFGFYNGHVCVAQVAGNAGCNSNYDFVSSQLGTVIPEPGTVVLLATGLIGVFGFARRRRRV